MSESKHLRNLLFLVLATPLLLHDVDAGTEAVFYKRWDRAYGGLDLETLLAAKPTLDGGFILVGRSTPTGSHPTPGGNRTAKGFGDADVWIVRTDARGVLLWDRCFGGSRSDSPVGVIPTDDGGFVIAGTTTSPADGNKTTGTFGSSDYWVFKLNEQGDRVWEADFGGSQNDTLASLVQLTDGGFLLGGTSDSAVSGNKTAARLGGRDYWAVKVDAQGHKVWDQVFGGTSNGDLLVTAMPTADNGAILGGVSDSPPGPGKTSTSQRPDDPWVVKLDSSGARVWDHNYANSNDEPILPASMRMVAGDADHIVLSVEATAPGSSSRVIRVFELDGSGALVSRRELDPALGDWVALSFQVLPQPGGDILFGYSSARPPAERYQLRQFAADGSLVGGRLITADPRISGFLPIGGLIQTGDHDFVLAGSSQDTKVVGDRSAPVLGAIDFWLLKFGRRLAPAGTPQILVNGQVNLDNPLVVAVSSVLTFATSFPQGTVFYTTDGNVPDTTSHPGGESLSVTAPLTLRAVAYSADHSQSAETGPISVQVVPERHLTMSVTGQGTIDLDGDEPIADGTLLFVEAVANVAGWRFKSWGDDLAGQPQVTTLLMDRDRTISATFESIAGHSLTVTTPGAGTVSGFGESGVKEYADGTMVPLSAVPNPGWSFLRWTGDAAGTDPTIAVTMDRDRAVQAIFGTTLSTTAAGPGVVLSSQLETDLPFGSVVRLTAVPQAGSYFDTWGGAAAGNANPLDFPVIVPKPTVSASFAALPAGRSAFTVIVVGSGKVTQAPAGNIFSAGSLITLTAVPDAGETFLGWAGDATGVKSPLKISGNSSRLIYAKFTPAPTLSLPECLGVDCSDGIKLVLTSVTPGPYDFEVSADLLHWTVVGRTTNETAVGSSVGVHPPPPPPVFPQLQFFRARFAPLP